MRPINSSKDSTIDFIAAWLACAGNARVAKVKLYPKEAKNGFPDGGRGSTQLCEEVKEGGASVVHVSTGLVLWW